jgi:hypothetical protein
MHAHPIDPTSLPRLVQRCGVGCTRVLTGIATVPTKVKGKDVSPGIPSAFRLGDWDGYTTWFGSTWSSSTWSGVVR